MNTAIRKSTTTEERYFHIRPKDDKEGNGGTVYFRAAKDTNGRDVWDASASHISKNDTFSRKTGRTMAKRHFAKGDVVPLWTEEPTFEIAVDVLNRTRKR